MTTGTDRDLQLDVRFAPAGAVADALVYEGYVLYPYRASALKNRCRWQFGVLAPPEHVARDPSERSSTRTQYVVHACGVVTLSVRVRFLHVQHRAVVEVDAQGRAREVDALDTGTEVVVPWDEAIEVVVDLPPLRVEGRAAGVEVPIELPTSSTVETVVGLDGTVRGRIERVRAEVRGRARAEVVAVDPPSDLLQVTVTVENTTPWADVPVDRDEMARHALVAVHVMVATDGGVPLSSLTPPDDALDAVKACRNEGSFPVLVAGVDADLVLSSPITMYDHPAVAPESAGDLYDATEIDEILALRVLTLTPEEKAAARALDPRAAAIVDRCDALTPEAWSSLHGTIRSTSTTAREPDLGAGDEPGDDVVVVDGVEIRAGSSVVLRPGRRADAQDLFLAGRPATVAGVFRDIDGTSLLVGVTVDDDPATELLAWHGRYLYFHPDELEPRR